MGSLAIHDLTPLIGSASSADIADLLTGTHASQLRALMGDLVIWHNPGTMHRARPFDPSSGRLLHRFTIDGDEVITAPPAGCVAAS
jgi:Taurine catabolism dioxygenase TauD, TfdA family